MDTGMIRTGASAIRVAATPASVYCTARSDSETPRKGPKKAPMPVLVMALRSASAARTLGQRPVAVKTTTNPTSPTSTRIWVEAKAL